VLNTAVYTVNTATVHNPTNNVLINFTVKYVVAATMPVYVAAYVVLVCSTGEFPMLKVVVPVGCTSVTCVVLVPTVISAVKSVTRGVCVLRYSALSFPNTVVDVLYLVNAALLLLLSKLHTGRAVQRTSYC
jgi:hypothetical protein